MSLQLDGLNHLWAHIANRLSTKVDKVEGKTLSSNDYTTDEKNKLAGVEAGANKTTVVSVVEENNTNPVTSGAVYSAIRTYVDEFILGGEW